MRRMSLLWIVSVIGIAGCTTVGRNLAESGEVSVYPNPSKLVRIQAVTVRQDGEQLVVRGVVRRTSQNNTPIWGHVNVTAFDASGQRIGHAVVGYSPPTLPQKGPRLSHFTARLPICAAQGTVVHVEHHVGGHGREDCPPLASAQSRGPGAFSSFLSLTDESVHRQGCLTESLSPRPSAGRGRWECRGSSSANGSSS